LAEEEYTAGEIVDEFDMSAPAISQHLKILRDANLVKVKVEGQRRVHSLNPAGFTELDAWLHRTKRAWSERGVALTADPVAKPPDKPSTQPAPEVRSATADDNGWEIIKMENQ
jgi:DNA-binding transcriptional ArsR family regulator